MSADCHAVRYAPTKECGPVTFRVVYRATSGRETSEHPACFVHGLAEVERHTRSGGIARCDLEPEEAKP